MTDIQKLAEIMQMLIAQELGEAKEGSTKFLIYSNAYESLQKIKE